MNTYAKGNFHKEKNFPAPTVPSSKTVDWHFQQLPDEDSLA